MRRLLLLLAVFSLSAAGEAGAEPQWRGDEPSVAVARDGRVAVAWVEKGATVRVALGTPDGRFAAPQDLARMAGPDRRARHAVVLLPADGATLVAWQEVRAELWEGETEPRRVTSVRTTIAMPGGAFEAPRRLGPEGFRYDGGLFAAVGPGGRAMLAWNRDVYGGATAVRSPHGRFGLTESDDLGYLQAIGLGGTDSLLLAARACRRNPCLTARRASGEARIGRSGETAAAMNEHDQAVIAWREHATARTRVHTPGGPALGTELPGGRGLGHPAVGITESGEALVLYDVTSETGRSLRAVARAPGQAAFAPVTSPTAGTAVRPSLALAPGGSGIAAWHDGRALGAALRDPGGGWRPLEIGGFSSITDAVAASDAGAAFGWTDSEGVVRVVIAPAEGAPRTAELSRYPPGTAQPVVVRAAPRLYWLRPRGRALRLRGRKVAASVACGGEAACAGRLRVLGPRGRELGSTGFRIRPYGRRRVAVRLARIARDAELFLDLPGTVSDRRRPVRLTVE